ncbi:MAG: rod shape-determining protein MreC [Marmoricola sp.]
MSEVLRRSRITRMPEPGRRRRPVVGLALLVLASLTVITLDARGGTGSPIEPLRAAVGTVVGPAETASAAAVRPFARLGGFVHDNRDLRRQVATLTAQNDRLRSQAALTPLDRHRLAELDALTRTAHDTGYTLVAAHVVAVGPSQSFARTVTLDAGTSSGVRADMTVVAGSGLVGRVVRATRSNATVLLIVDDSSTVGGRLGSDLEIGNVSGTGSLSGSSGLQLDLADGSVAPARGDVVVTWGSPDGVPYVAGIPIGRVGQVRANPRTLSKRAVVRPFVDFSALDVVGVVVPHGTHGDRPVIADGTIR